ncbi:MAG: addiction module protein, partial [Actinomycetota bacterium]|nr:addiction module protein [Actinomycetota bacterium]
RTSGRDLRDRKFRRQRPCSTIQRDALALRDEDRADLAAQLLASLDSPAVDDPATIGAVWALELERRATRVLSGEAATVDWATVRAHVADHLKE